MLVGNYVFPIVLRELGTRHAFPSRFNPVETVAPPNHLYPNMSAALRPPLRNCPKLESIPPVPCSNRSMKLLLSVLTICSLADAQSARPAKMLAANSSAVRLTDPQASKGQASIKPDLIRPSADAATPAPATSAKYEYYTNVTIPAGQSINLDSALDYSSSDTIAVTVRSAKADIANLVGTGYFTVPTATEYFTQEAFSGQNFNYSNTGGASFTVCGPQFRLTLQNQSTATITLSSVLVYTHIL